MKRKFWAILLITFLLIPQIAHALSYEQVTQKAKEITVLIDGCNSGSGVLYQRQGNTYYVLTAKHMVENRNVNCLVITPDGFRYETNIDKIAIPLSGIDLAVLQFTSERNYTLAEFGGLPKGYWGENRLCRWCTRTNFRHPQTHSPSDSWQYCGYPISPKWL